MLEEEKKLKHVDLRLLQCMICICPVHRFSTETYFCQPLLIICISFLPPQTGRYVPETYIHELWLFMDTNMDKTVILQRRKNFCSSLYDWDLYLPHSRDGTLLFSSSAPPDTCWSAFLLFVGLGTEVSYKPLLKKSWLCLLHLQPTHW